MHSLLASALVALAASSQTTAHPTGSISCREIVIPVTSAADNLVLPSNLTLEEITPALQENAYKANTTRIGGRYEIAARYCIPRRPNAARSQTLQILVHGITLDRDYWSGLAPPGTLPGQEEYSWVEYFGARGYPTLSIDRLCNGQSSHPDGIAACQSSLETATIVSLIHLARAGSLTEIATCFKTIIVVGHSYGSLVASQLATQFPAAADGLILSGYSSNLTNSLPDFVLPQLAPAAEVEPKVFGQLQKSYQTPTNETGTIDFFYYGDFAARIADRAYKHRGIVTLGEIASLLLGQLPAAQYQGAFLMLDGAEDAPFCENTPGAAPPGNCFDLSIEATVRKNFPEAHPFAVHYTPDTGHLVNLHRTAQSSFAAAADFLAAAGF